MAQYFCCSRRIFTNLPRILGFLVLASSFWFVFSLLFENLTGSAWRYVYSVNLPICIIYAIVYLKQGGRVKQLRENFVDFIKPFLPLLLGILLVFILHHVGRKEAGFNLYGIARIILISGFAYSCLMTLPRISPSVFFILTSIGSFTFLAEMIFLLFTKDVSLWEVRKYTFLNITEFGRMYSLFGGLSFLGFFYCYKEKLSLKIFYLLAGLTGLLIPVFILYVRSVVLTTSIAIIAAYLITKVRCSGETLKLGKKSVSLIALIFVVLCVSVGPIKDRFIEGVQETEAFINSSANTFITSDSHTAAPLEKNDVSHQKAMATNFGARLAMWQTAWKEFSSSPIIGVGVGSPARTDSFKALYKDLGYFPKLPHFHSDYVQALVVGGILLFLCLISTQVLLFISSLQQPIKLFLLLSIISYGFVDLGFFLQSDFAVFIGAWVILCSWNPNNLKSGLITC